MKRSELRRMIREEIARAKSRKRVNENMGYAQRSIIIGKEDFNYLLPAIRHKLSRRGGNMYYLTIDDAKDLQYELQRLSGLYDFYDDIPYKVVRKVFESRTLDAFLDYVNG